jgi:hypothetical protein
MPDENTPAEVAVRAALHDAYGRVASTSNVERWLRISIARSGRARRRKKPWILAAAAVAVIAIGIGTIYSVAAHRRAPAVQLSPATTLVTTTALRPTTTPLGSTSSSAPGSVPESEATTVSSTSSFPSGSAGRLSDCGDPAPGPDDYRLHVSTARPLGGFGTYTVSVAITDKTLWHSKMNILDQMVIVRAGVIVARVTNVSPVLAVTTVKDGSEFVIDHLLLPANLPECRGGSPVGPLLTPGPYDVFVEASAARVTGTDVGPLAAGSVAGPYRISIG